MQGRILKGIAGFYYVQTGEHGVYECKAKGIFRKEKTKPLVGDLVDIDILDEAEKTGNLVRIHERKNELIRPAVANVDQALVIFAAAMPEPNLNLLDRFLLTMERRQIRTVICFNKCDLVGEEQMKQLRAVYEPAGYGLHFISVRERRGIDEVRRLLEGRLTTVAGPSGVGKSSLMNCLQDQVTMETGRLSDKAGRGRHTTRHAQLIEVASESYIVDTPGFSSLSVDELQPEEVAGLFAEFAKYEAACRFGGCAHIHEPGCGVKEAAQDGRISRQRYDHYIQIYEECKNKRRY